MKATTAARLGLAGGYVFFTPAFGDWRIDAVMFVLLLLGLGLTYYIDETYGGT